MIPLVAPCITRQDEQHLAACAYDGRAFDERTVREFEEAFAECVGARWAVAVNSGASALQLAIDVRHDIREGRELGQYDSGLYEVPTLTCSALANAVSALGKKPALRDCAFDVRSAQMTQFGGWVTVHAFGRETINVGSPDSLDDLTLSLGADMNPPSKFGVCSTHASKMISTGRGGVIFGWESDGDSWLSEKVRRLAYYDSTPNGTLGAYSLGMSSMQAALGLSQLRQLDAFIARRREIAARYSEAFAAAGIECPDADCGSVFFRYLIAVTAPPARVSQLKAHGIEAGRGVYPPLHRQLGLPDDDFPGATAAVNSLLSVPCHPSLTDVQVGYITEKVLEVCA